MSSKSAQRAARTASLDASEQLAVLNGFLSQLPGDPGPKQTLLNRFVAVLAHQRIDAINDAGRSLLRGHVAAIAKTTDAAIDRLANTLADASQRMGYVHMLLVSFVLPANDPATREKRARKIVREIRRVGIGSTTVDQVLRMMDVARSATTGVAIEQPSQSAEDLNKLQQRVAKISVHISRMSGEPLDHEQFGSGSLGLADAIIARLEKMQKIDCARSTAVVAPEGPSTTSGDARSKDAADLLTNQCGLFLLEMMTNFGTVYWAFNAPQKPSDADLDALLGTVGGGKVEEARFVASVERHLVLAEAMTKFDSMRTTGFVLLV